MDGIFALLGIIALLVGIPIVLNLLGQGARVAGKETYFGPPQVKFKDETLPESEITIKIIMYRGIIPNPRDMNVSFMLSALDSTEGKGNLKPVLSLTDAAQEPETTCYQMTKDLGHIKKGSICTDWAQFGVICPALLQPSVSGTRTIQVIIRMFNTDNPPSVFGGQSIDDGEMLHNSLLEFTHNFTEKGYEEAVQHREEAQAISLKIGVAVAMADGSLDDAEGEVLKNWITVEISSYPEDKKKYLKGLFNRALKEGFEQAQSRQLALSPLVDRLAEIGEKKTKYDAVELCLDVMSADGVANPGEMMVIRNVAEALDLDMDEIESMREKVTLEVSMDLTSKEGLESLVGIDFSWSDEQKRKHLRTEFQKWSNRLNALPSGDKRNNAQSMLDNIAELRKGYG